LALKHTPVEQANGKPRTFLAAGYVSFADRSNNDQAIPPNNTYTLQSSGTAFSTAEIYMTKKDLPEQPAGENKRINGSAQPANPGAPPAGSATAGQPKGELAHPALHDQMRRTSLLTQLSIEFRETLDAETIVAQTLRILTSNLIVSSASIILVGPSSTIELASTTTGSAVKPMDAALAGSVIEKGLAGWVLRHGSTVALSDILQDRRWLQFSEQHMAGSVIVLPIRQSRAILGVLTVHRDTASAFTSHDLLLMEGVAAQLGVALSAAQHYRNERHRREQAMTLFAMSQYLTAERSFEELAAIVQAKSLEVLRADYGVLFLDMGDPVLMPVAAPDRLRGARDMALIDRIALAATQAWQQRTIVRESMPADANALSYIALPLIHSGHAIGALVLVRAALNEVTFSANTWSLLMVFTHVIAAACANIQLVVQLKHYTQSLEALVDRRTHEIAKSRDVLRLVFDSQPDGLLLLDTEEHIMAANSMFCYGVIGRNPRKVVGQKYAAILGELEQRGGLQRVPIEADSNAGTPSYAQHIACIDTSGLKRWYTVERIPVIGDDDQVEQYLEFWRDER
jgi:GAF domain-containing protein